MEGKIALPLLEPPPEPLQTLLSSTSAVSARFRDDIWKYNRAFAFTSLGVTEDHSVNRGRGPPVFRISGELHHWSGALTPPPGRSARYAQLYIYEPQAALEDRVRQNNDLNPQLLSALQAMLNDHHHYVPLFKHAFEVLQQNANLNVEDLEVPHTTVVM